jgi:hypothetical protein
VSLRAQLAAELALELLEGASRAWAALHVTVCTLIVTCITWPTIKFDIGYDESLLSGRATQQQHIFWVLSRLPHNAVQRLGSSTGWVGEVQPWEVNGFCCRRLAIVHVNVAPYPVTPREPAIRATWWGSKVMGAALLQPKVLRERPLLSSNSCSWRAIGQE